ncbi:hypothetical protein AS359_01920 [Comamonas kerstersii]|uniref:Transposase n=1 Tax=Comamonas kerstersii TaxID=225992 RepID=A0A0W7YYJ4_9BURK|nr:hypothetical protein AS359_01920 [Comamonas kerstersii]
MKGRYIASESSFARVTGAACPRTKPAQRPSTAAANAKTAEHEHRHSGIQFVTPQQRHTGQDKAILAHRNQVYEQAKQNRPARWSRHTRNWQPIEAVALNPERIESITQKYV